MGTCPMPSFLPKVISSAWAHAQCIQFCQKYETLHGHTPNASISAKSNKFCMGTQLMPSFLPKAVPAAQSGIPVGASHRCWQWSRSRRPSLALCSSAARHNALGFATTKAQRCTIPDPHGAHLVSGCCHTAEPGPRAVHSCTASRLGVSMLGDRTIPVNKKKGSWSHA